jgi:uncharacterized membrane protein
MSDAMPPAEPEHGSGEITSGGGASPTSAPGPGLTMAPWMSRLGSAIAAAYGVAIWLVILPLGHHDVVPLFRTMHTSPAMKEGLIRALALFLPLLLSLAWMSGSQQGAMASLRGRIAKGFVAFDKKPISLQISNSTWLQGAGLLAVLPLVFLPIYDLRARVYLGSAMIGAACAIWAGWRPWQREFAGRSSALAVSEPRADVQRTSRLGAVFLFGCVTLFLGLISQARHAGHWTSLIDLGLFYEQYDNARGQLLYSPTLGMSFMGEHFSPLLVLLTPVMWLFRNPLTLLWIQAASLGLGSAVLWLYARERVGGVALPLMVALVWAISPINQQAAAYDFHMDMLEPPIVFAAVMFLHRGWLWRTSLCFVGLWCIKEDTFLYTSVLSFYAFVVLKHRQWAALMAVVGLLQAGVIIGWWLPMVREGALAGSFSTGGSEEGYAFAARFSHLGAGLKEIASTAATNPWYVVGHLLQGTRVGSVLALFAPFLFVSLAGGRRLILVLPAMEMLLANAGAMGDFTYYYGAVVLPFAAIAAVESLHDGQLRKIVSQRIALSFGMAAGLASLLLMHPASVFSLQNDGRTWHRSERHERIDAALQQIPAGASVSATGYMAVRLQPGRDVRMMPWRLDEVDWVVVDLQSPAWPRTLEQMQSSLAQMMRGNDWTVVTDDAGFLILRRTPGAGVPLEREQIRRSLQEWRREAERTENTRFYGRAVRDASASDGWAVEVGTSDLRGEGHLIWGPFSKLSRGRWQAVWRVQWRDDSWLGVPDDTTVLTADVFCGSEFARQSWTAAELRSGEWHELVLPFEADAATPPCEFRSWYHDRGALRMDWAQAQFRGEQEPSE